VTDEITFSLIGIENVLIKFNAVSYDIKRKGGRFALRKAAQFLVEKVQDNARRIDDPETANNIAANVALRWSRQHFQQTGDLLFRVGILGGAGGRASSDSLSGFPGGDTRHWRMLEFGTENMPAQPIMRNALADNIKKALDRALHKKR
jgi:HK97 gp10 family phage protein